MKRNVETGKEERPQLKFTLEEKETQKSMCTSLFTKRRRSGDTKTGVKRNVKEEKREQKKTSGIFQQRRK